jgi:hypothetical protein
MNMPETFNYVRFMNATWALLHSTREGQRLVVEGLPGPERRVMEQTFGPWLDVEMARRRKTISRVLFLSFPVTYFAYVATEGVEGVMHFLESRAWRSRPAQPGSAFPPAATTSRAFSTLLHEIGWAEKQVGWVREAFAFESRFLFGGRTPGPRQVGGLTVRLPESAWVAEASFDVPRCGRLLRECGQENPWHDALYFVMPRPSPFAIISIPSATKVRRITLSGQAVTGLRWLWDEEADISAEVFESPVFRHALDAGIVRILEGLAEVGTRMEAMADLIGRPLHGVPGHMRHMGCPCGQ